jgi:hypothetical protein
MEIEWRKVKRRWAPDNDKEIALFATTKRLGKTAGNKKGDNPNANKMFNHCQK